MTEGLEGAEPRDAAGQAGCGGAVGGRAAKIRRHPADRPVVTEIETRADDRVDCAVNMQQSPTQ
ncbi:hypothetical protein [Frankia sp. Cas3]|uniref:hypothetical protein n=1 Tax=Frankia sp. Cas3 TaxID=3073926 RepID=UPI002AD51987|nr:hypothetical protein [Frankia sp. Cas3]